MNECWFEHWNTYFINPWSHCDILAIIRKQIFLKPPFRLLRNRAQMIRRPCFKGELLVWNWKDQLINTLYVQGDFKPVLWASNISLNKY